jgi:hypothetical protein
MKQTKKFLRYKAYLRDVQTFRWGFPQGYWATNGRMGTLSEPITLESIRRSLKMMDDLKNSLVDVNKYEMRFPGWSYPPAPRPQIWPLEGY